MATQLKKGVTVYKKVFLVSEYCSKCHGPCQLNSRYPAVATLFLPKGTLVRLIPTPRNKGVKNRANRAVVKSIKSLSTGASRQIAYADYDKSFVYRVGRPVTSSFDKSSEQCAPGIHFYGSKTAARNH